MRVLTEDAVLRCPHRARVNVPPTQTLVRINGRRLLVNDDPENKAIIMCPNSTLSGILACTKSLRPDVGYSTFVKIDGRTIVLDNITGYTNGTPPASYKYICEGAGQDLVESAA